MALIEGANVFGVAVIMTVADNPRGSQANAYPGINGIEELDQGNRGRVITIDGRLIGASPGDLGSAEATIRSYDDGLIHPITDQFGGVWPDCKFDSFEPQGKVVISPDLNGTGLAYSRRYVVRFRSLT